MTVRIFSSLVGGKIWAVFCRPKLIKKEVNIMVTRLELGYRETRRGKITTRETIAELEDRVGVHNVGGETIKLDYGLQKLTIDASQADKLKDMLRNRKGSSIVEVDTGRRGRGRHDLDNHRVLFVSTRLGR
jgi:hypothetical protein